MGNKKVKEELHVIILWDAKNLHEVEPKINNTFEVVRKINMPSLLNELGEVKKNQIMNALYRYEIERFGIKGSYPFVVFIVIDKNPEYGIRKTSRMLKPVNLNLYNLKHSLRKGRMGFLHASDSTEECRDILNVISHVTDDPSIIALLNDRRPTFNNLNDFFKEINSYPDLKYVVQRNFDNYPNDYKLDKHADIDVQVNDYFQFKAITGGKASKKPFYEDGGYKFANRVNFSGNEVQVDIRVNGDNYYCEQWQNDMLETRIFDDRGFYIMNDINHFYSLLYHALCHKNSVSGTYKNKFLELSKKINLPLTQENVNDRKFMFNILNKFMETKGYEYVNPVEKSIQCRRS